MGKYEQFSKDIIENIGGKENIASVAHCMTRLRFKLIDESKANDEVIKNLSGVLSLIKSGGQYQIVIGNHVSEVHKEVQQLAGISGESSGPEVKKKMKLSEKFVDIVSGIFLPSLGVLCASGMIKGLLAVLVAVGALATTDSVYILLYAIGDAMFHFFPMFIGLNAAKKFGLNQYIGLAIGAVFCYPTVNATELEFFGREMIFMYYYSVLPVVATVFLATFVERFFNRHIPAVIKGFFVPMLTMLIVIPLGFLVIGPLTMLLGGAIAIPFSALMNFSPVLAGLVIGGLWQILIIFGLHMPIGMIAGISMVSGTPSALMAYIFTTSFAQTAVIFAIWLKTKNKDLKTLSFGAGVSAFFGITEPAIYGITLPRIKFFVIACIGAGLGGAYYGLTGVLGYVPSGLGVFGFPTFLNPADPGPSIAHAVIGVLIAMVFSFVVTLILFKDEEETSEKSIKAKELKKVIVKAPIEGEIIPLEQINDEAFASGALGKGIAIRPTSGKVIAPFTGTVKVLFPTLHAIGLESEDGAELLIHVGMNTVQLEGKHFIPHVKQGDHVNAGDLMLEFDINAISEAGYSIETPIIVSNSAEYLDVLETQEKLANFEDNIITLLPSNN